MTVAEKITDMLSFANILPLLITCILIGIASAILFLLSERQRYIAINAEKQLKNINQNVITVISEQYDIHSNKNIMHAEYERLEKRAAKRTPMTILSIFMATILMISLLCIYSFADTYYTAKQHGYNSDLNATASSLWKSIHLSPVEDTVPEDLSQKIIIYYRFGCKDCEATYDTLSKTLSAYSDVYWIASRSPQGKKLLEQYPVDQVPTGIYIRADGTYLAYTLYKSSPDGPIVDSTELNNLINATAYDRRMNSTE